MLCLMLCEVLREARQADGVVLWTLLMWLVIKPEPLGPHLRDDLLSPRDDSVRRLRLYESE